MTGRLPDGDADLFRALLDNASLFPPARLPMSAAVSSHLRHLGAWYSDLAGPFVCADDRLSELRAMLTAANLPELDLALIVTGGAAAVIEATEAVAADPRLRLRAVEIPTGRDSGPHESAAAVAAALDRALLAGATCYIELPLSVFADQTAGEEIITLLDGRGYRPKLRTGGMSATAFPTEQALGAALSALTATRMPFKCTAGLHHAVRHTAADTGFEHHGFLNVMLAVDAAISGAGQQEVAGVLAQRDAAAIASAVGALDATAAADIRGLFTSFGTCSIDEPVADLAGLGLIGRS